MAKSRSPEYPAIGLRDAIERVRRVYESGIYQNPVSKEVFAQQMGYKSLSGASLPVLSALSKYGLIEGRGNDTRVSPLAVEIIAHDPGTPQRATAIRSAASLPELFDDLDKRYPGGKTPDSAIRSYLLTRGFIPPAADAAIRSYRETKSLVEAESATHNLETSIESEPPNVGDFIQVEIGGAFQLPKPARVRAIREHEGRRWVFIEGSETGIPVEQAVLHRRVLPPDEVGAPTPPRLSEDPPAHDAAAGVRREVFALDEGDLVISYPEELSLASYEDLQTYLELFLRKAKRRAEAKRFKHELDGDAPDERM